MLRKKLVSVLLVMAMVLGLGGTALAAGDGTLDVANSEYNITEAYTYEVLPGSEEWNSLKSASEKRQICYVPEDIVQSMTTQALVKTVVEYPLFPDMYAYTSVQEGIDAVSRYFPGINELLSREDALPHLEAYANAETERTEATDISLYNADILIRYLNTVSNTSASTLSAVSVVTVYTPKGTPVMAYYELTWEDFGTTATEAKAQNIALLSLYPSASQDAPIDPSYNCHSYAWYQQSTANKCWIDFPDAYVTDGSYVSATPAAGNRITYYDSALQQYSHSGILISGGTSPSNIRVRSKWGMLGLIIHNADDCPYYDTNAQLSYWKKAS